MGAVNDIVIKNHSQRPVNSIDVNWKHISMRCEVPHVAKTLASVRELDDSDHITVFRTNVGDIKYVNSG